MCCRGLLKLTYPAYLSGLLFSVLPRVAPFCVPGGVRVVSTSDWTAGQHAHNRVHYGGQVPASSSITTKDLVLRSAHLHHSLRRRAPHLAGRQGVLRPRGT